MVVCQISKKTTPPPQRWILTRVRTHSTAAALIVGWVNASFSRNKSLISRTLNHVKCAFSAVAPSAWETIAYSHNYTRARREQQGVRVEIVWARPHLEHAHQIMTTATVTAVIWEPTANRHACTHACEQCVCVYVCACVCACAHYIRPFTQDTTRHSAHVWVCILCLRSQFWSGAHDG